MRYSVEEVVFDDMSDEELLPLLARTNETNRELRPRSVDLTIEDYRMFSDSPGTVQNRFVARNREGKLVGISETRYADDGSNPDTMRCSTQVWPEFRRQGAGTAMLQRICDEAEGVARSKLLAMHVDTVPAGSAFARAVGGTDKQQFHENVLRIEDLDVDLMRQWVKRGTEMARGYSVEVREGDWPEVLHEDVAHLFYVLERDMPMSEGQEPREWTVELVREILEHYKDGIDALFSMAFDSTGRAVGMSELIRRHSDPTTWEVTVTMVDPEHRGKSLGKWLKGAVNLAAIDRWPGGVYQETGNAFTNDAMLAINHAMGFEHELTVTDVEVTVEDAREYLASRR
jgi:mycothiol synthase